MHFCFFDGCSTSIKHIFDEYSKLKQTSRDVCLSPCIPAVQTVFFFFSDGFKNLKSPSRLSQIVPLKRRRRLPVVQERYPTVLAPHVRETRLYARNRIRRHLSGSRHALGLGIALEDLVGYMLIIFSSRGRQYAVDASRLRGCVCAFARCWNGRSTSFVPCMMMLRGLLHTVGLLAKASMFQRHEVTVLSLGGIGALGAWPLAATTGLTATYRI